MMLQLIETGELTRQARGHILFPGRGERYSRTRESADRYQYDLDLCPAVDGWQQFDTTSDAWYFGVWVHPTRQVIVSYQEGDEYVDVFTDREKFAAEIDRLNTIYPQPPALVALGLDGSKTEYYDKRLTGAQIRAA